MLHIKTGPYWLQHKGLDIGVWWILVRLENKASINGLLIICILNAVILCIIRKTLKGRKQTSKYGRGTERHLPKTDKSVVRPVGERH